MALFVLLEALLWVQRAVFAFSYVIPVFVFVGSWGPAVLLVGPIFVPVLRFRVLPFWVLLLTLF